VSGGCFDHSFKLLQRVLGQELMRPDFAAFSYRASTSLIDRGEKKKEMSFVSGTLVLA